MSGPGDSIVSNTIHANLYSHACIYTKACVRNTALGPSGVTSDFACAGLRKLDMGSQNLCTGVLGSHLGACEHCFGPRKLKNALRRCAREPLERSKLLHKRATEPLGHSKTLQRRTQEPHARSKSLRSVLRSHLGA